MKFLWIILILLVGCHSDIHEMNHLKNERSSYLKDSQNDDIWWYPWGEKPLKLAKEKDQLIFLSIGYSSCFACEKMQKTVYSKPEVAEEINKHFISIKIDREERPDLDSYFLNMQSTIMKFGAWPINMILTPDLKPVFATTLLDKNKFLAIIKKSSAAWQNERAKILQGTTRYEIQSTIQPSHEEFFEKDFELIKDFYARYTHRFDTLYGGKSTGKSFNTKFPVNDEMRLLLRYHAHTGEQQPLKMAHKTMTSVVQSALFDHIDGGFHRYSITRDWNTPNYEKMLSDQASFLNALIDIYLVKKTELYKISIEKTVKFILNSFQDPRGGFYSSFGSSLNGMEGHYYNYQPNELQKYLSKENGKLFNEFYSYTRPQIRHQGRRGIRRKTTFNKDELQIVEKEISDYRKTRGDLLLDNKMITADNAYILSALSRLHRIWPSEALFNTIKFNLDSLINQHTSLTNKLYRCSIKGRVCGPAILDDYAYLINALIEFYQISFDESYLNKAMIIQGWQDQNHYDENSGLYFYSASQRKFLKNQHLFTDLTRPSGMAMSYWNLIRLANYFNQIDFENKAQKLIDAYPDRLKADPISFSSLLLGLDFKISKPKNFIIVGNQKECESFSREGFEGLNPYLLFSCINGSSHLPMNKDKKKINAKPTFYICDSRSCQPPTNDYNTALKYYAERI